MFVAILTWLIRLFVKSTLKRVLLTAGAWIFALIFGALKEKYRNSSQSKKDSMSNYSSQYSDQLIKPEVA